MAEDERACRHVTPARLLALSTALGMLPSEITGSGGARPQAGSSTLIARQGGEMLDALLLVRNPETRARLVEMVRDVAAAESQAPGGKPPGMSVASNDDRGRPLG